MDNFRTLTHRATCLLRQIIILWQHRPISMAESGEDVLQSEGEADKHSSDSQADLQSLSSPKTGTWFNIYIDYDFHWSTNTTIHVCYLSSTYRYIDVGYL